MKRKTAFTIIELLISIMIIGILSSIGYKQYTKAIMKANAAALVSQLKSLESGMAKYYSDTGSMPVTPKFLFTSPDSVTDLNEIDLFGSIESNPDGEIADYWGGPYIENEQMTSVVSDTCGGGSIAFAPMTGATTTNNCIKSKLGGSICIGAKISNGGYIDSSGTQATKTGGTTGDYNVFVITGLDNEMAKEVYKTLNHKKPKLDNAYGILDNAGDEKIGITSPTSYAAGSGCLIYKYYGSNLRLN